MEIYDRDGNLVPGSRDEVLRWYGEKCADLSYKIVSQDKMDEFVVSTVWLGLDHSFLDDSEPLIFETMVFDRRGWDGDRKKGPGMIDLACDRYPTEKLAREGHEAMVFAVTHEPEHFRETRDAYLKKE